MLLHSKANTSCDDLDGNTPLMIALLHKSQRVHTPLHFSPPVRVPDLKLTNPIVMAAITQELPGYTTSPRY